MTVVHRALRAAGQSSTMEDADRLLLLALGRVGCSIPANVRSMADVVTENALPAMCASCLRALDASGEGAAGTGTVSPSPEPYPAEATARIRACEALAARLNAIARSEGAAPESDVLGETKQWTCVDVLVPAEATARDACAFLLDASYAARSARRKRASDSNVSRHASGTDTTSASRTTERDALYEYADVPSATAVLARVAGSRAASASRRGARGAARGARRRGALASSRAALAFARAGGRLYAPAGFRGTPSARRSALHRDPRGFERLAANADRAWRETLAIESLDRTRERAERASKKRARATRGSRRCGRGEEKPARRVRRVRSFSERSQVLLKLSSESRGCVVLRCEEDVVVIEIAERGTNRVLFVARLAFL